MSSRKQNLCLVSTVSNYDLGGRDKRLWGPEGGRVMQSALTRDRIVRSQAPRSCQTVYRIGTLDATVSVEKDKTKETMLETHCRTL